MPLKVRAVGKSDLGRRRNHNEDFSLIDEKRGLFIVADGMGGHAAGEVASQKAVDVIHEFISQPPLSPEPFGQDPSLSPSANFLRNAIKMANLQIHEMAREKDVLSGMGTTVVCLLVKNSTATIANVGDSRCYLLRDHQLHQLTEDHSFVHEQVKKNLISHEETRTHPLRNIITRALGPSRDVEVDFFFEEIKPGDLFLLCTDGLTSMVEDKVILEVLTEPSASLEVKNRNLIAEANLNGGDDNITIILVEISRP